MEPKKVLIFTEGGTNIGFGHITRCTSLYQALEDEGISVGFIVNGDEAAEALLKGKEYEMFDWAREEEQTFRVLEGARSVVIDSYMAGCSLYKKISEKVENPIYIDDTKRIDYPRGIVVNTSIAAGEMHYPAKNEIMYLLGAKYALLRMGFWEVPQKRISENLESVLITFGGDDSRNMTPKVLDFLKNNYPALKKRVIVGRGCKNRKAVKDNSDRKTKIILHPEAVDMRKALIESDIAISAGGQTLYELARVGTPAIAVAVAGNQLSNIKGWKDKGFAEYAGWWEDKGLFEKIATGIELLRSMDVRRERSLEGRGLVDGGGSRRIVDLIANNGDRYGKE